jgi:hypothetical protein
MDELELLEAVSLMEDAPREAPSIDATGFTGLSGTYSRAVPRAGDVAVLAAALDEVGTPFPTDILRDEAHVTIVYSKEVPLDLGAVRGLPGPVSGTVTEAVYWPGHKGTGVAVLRIESPELEEAHANLVGAGCVHSFPTYMPHMTVCDEVGERTGEVDRWLRAASDALRGTVLRFDRVIVEDVN